MNKLRSILFVALLWPFCGIAHGDKIPLSFSGTVSDKAAGQAVEGATISIEKNGQVIHSSQTDHSGHFSIKIEGPLTRRDQIKLRIEKQGFRASTYLPINSQNDNLEIELARKAPMPIIKPIGGSGPVIAI